MKVSISELTQPERAAVEAAIGETPEGASRPTAEEYLAARAGEVLDSYVSRHREAGVQKLRALGEAIAAEADPDKRLRLGKLIAEAEALLGLPPPRK